MIISKKKYEAEINKRVEEAIRNVEERMWQNERERGYERSMAKLEHRIIALEKKNGIDHPSHHYGDTVPCPNW